MKPPDVVSGWLVAIVVVITVGGVCLYLFDGSSHVVLCFRGCRDERGFGEGGRVQSVGTVELAAKARVNGG